MVRASTWLVLIVLTLLAFGLVMLASASSIRGMELCQDPMFFVKRQLIWLALAIVAGGLVARIDYHHWRTFALPLFVLAVSLLVLVLIPGIGAKIGGSRRWLRLGAFQLQPSEFAKFAAIVVLAWWLAREQWRVKEFGRGAFVPILLLGMLAGLIFIEPDYGTTMLCGIVGMAIMFAGGTRLRYLLLFAGSGASLFCLAVMHNPVRLRRIIAFLDPEKYAQTYAFQLINAVNAFIAGGWRGVGLGASVQKHFYLPEAHTDFIFAIIGEELGLLGALAVLALFTALGICGLRISFKAPDMFGRLLGLGATVLLVVQALFNMGVVTGCLPTKGLTLPFISFGGSSLVMSLVLVGVLLNIAGHTVPFDESRPLPTSDAAPLDLRN